MYEADTTMNLNRYNPGDRVTVETETGAHAARVSEPDTVGLPNNIKGTVLTLAKTDEVLILSTKGTDLSAARGSKQECEDGCECLNQCEVYALYH